MVEGSGLTVMGRLGLVLYWLFTGLACAWAAGWSWVWMPDIVGDSGAWGLALIVLAPAPVSFGFGRAALFVLAGR